MRRDLPIYSILEPELEALSSGNASVHLAFFSLTLGISVGLAIALLTTDIPNPYTYATFIVGALGLGVLSGYFGVRAWLDVRQWRRHVREIRAGRVTIVEPRPGTS